MNNRLFYSGARTISFLEVVQTLGSYMPKNINLYLQFIYRRPKYMSNTLKKTKLNQWTYPGMWPLQFNTDLQDNMCSLVMQEHDSEPLSNTTGMAHSMCPLVMELPAWVKDLDPTQERKHAIFVFLNLGNFT